MSLLENYYDRHWRRQFDPIFAGTDIGREPTEERSRYVVLRFNFSIVNDALDTLEREFEAYCRTGGGLERLFITGVSPVTMDDVTSGFNIGTNLSLESDFNEILGFTTTEVRRLLETYRSAGVFDQDVDAALALMGEWYNGYRFAKGSETDLYNTDMVLYYLKHSIPNRPVPDELIDSNVRIDYGKVRHLLVVNRQLNGNFDLLRDVIGEEQVDTRIQSGFPLAELAEPENFLSLLHYFGLLSIRAAVHGVPRLAIPNQTVKRLMYGCLRGAYRDVGVFTVNRQYPAVRFVGLAVVFHGWELVGCEAVHR